jgi:hypothetical protein
VELGIAKSLPKYKSGAILNIRYYIYCENELKIDRIKRT